MKNSPSVESAFIERLGVMIESEGLPRTAGRLLGFLLLSPSPCRAADLAAELKISSGSVSTNTRLLERLGAIERVTIPGDRAAYFQLTHDPYRGLLIGQLDRMRRIHGVVAETRIALPASLVSARYRLADMEQFYGLAIRSADNLLARWEVTRSDHEGMGAERAGPVQRA